MTEHHKGYKGLPMEGCIATWYAKNTRKDMGEFRQLATVVTAQIAAGSRILEIAPGPGYLAIELAKLGTYTIVGLDISASFVRIATQNARIAGVNIEFRRGDAAAMPFDAESFDFIICRAAFKNFTEPLKALHEMHRVLKVGGKALIVDLRPDVAPEAIDTSPVKVTLPLSFCYTPGLLHRLSAGGHHAGQSVRTFCGEKSHFCDGAWHTGTRPGSGATRYVVCPDRPEAVHPHCVVFDRL